MTRLIPVTEAGRTVYLDSDAVALIRPVPGVNHPEASDVMVKGGLMLRVEEAPARLFSLINEGRGGRPASATTPG